MLQRFITGGSCSVFTVAVFLLCACGGGSASRVLPAGAAGPLQVQVLQRQPSTQTIVFPLTTANARPNSVALGTDANYWVTEGAIGKVARVSDTGVVTEFRFSLSHAPSYIAPGNGTGYVAFSVDATDAILGEIGSTGTIREIQLPVGSSPQEVVLDASGNLWITEAGANAIAKVTGGKIAATYSLPAGSAPYSDALGPDDNIWVTEPGVGSIAKIVPSTGAITQYALPAGRVPTMISSGTSNLDFGESTSTGAAYLAEMSTTGALSEYATTGKVVPEYLIAAGPLSSIWFTTPAPELEYATITSKKTTFTKLVGLSAPVIIRKGNDGNIWFPDAVNNALDVYVVEALTATPSSVSFTAVTQTQSFSISETNHTGTFYATSSNAGVATVSPASGKTFTVTANAAGTAAITFSDTAAFPKNGNGTTVSVTVTTTSISINSERRK